MLQCKTQRAISMSLKRSIPKPRWTWLTATPLANYIPDIRNGEVQGFYWALSNTDNYYL